MVTEWDFAQDTVTEDLNLYAKWTKLYNVSFDPDGGTLSQGAEEPGQAPLAQGETFIIPECPYEKEGCFFTCRSDGENQYQPGDVYTMPEHDVTLTAVWKTNLLPGDSDCNGILDISDALLALRASLGLITLCDEGFTNAGIDGNGKSSIFDALMIMKVVLGIYIEK